MLHKRITGLILAIVIVFGLMPFGVRGDNALTISQEGLNLLKKEEGFSRKPYWDYAQWTVGYGTKCPDEKLEEYQKNGIPEEEAEALLRSFINRFASAINQFAAKNNLTLTQNQFDALMLFSYNCGTGWMYSETGTLYNAVISGATGNQLIHAFTLWCNAGGQIKTFLLRRRLSEANIYLNGEYSQTPPENFCYTLYDACGGKVSPNVQGYDASLTAEILPTPTYAGYTFKGWYTAKSGGTRVEKLDSATKSARLYARWVSPDQVQEEELPQQGVTVTVTTDGLNVRKGPGTNYQSIQKINTGTVLVITETAKGGSFTWGKCNLGWVCLQYTTYDAATQPEANPQTGTVRVDGGGQLRIRTGPGTSYDVAGYLNDGDKVSILQTQKNWGKIDKGWISMNYVVLNEEEPEAPATKPVQTGTVKVSGQLWIRSGPGTSHEIVGYLNNGARVSVTETAKGGSLNWGKIDKGWICLSYVVMDTQTQATVTGTVKVDKQLRIRKGPGTSYDIAGYLNNGAKVTILEQKTVGSAVWGRIDKGWISLYYVTLDIQDAQPVVKTVTADSLRIRSGPGTTYKVVGYLSKNEKVEILETQQVGSAQWGKTAKGWISLAYTK
ncbi:MAG: SH3 domain-containing protein [Oscillospiraceae bacterium]|nr:SH3 domain-containing protein [Oscillospiraceae bacterium]